jgi:hypothetical protein
MMRPTASVAIPKNSATSSAPDPATTNVFQQPAVAVASFVTPASRLALLRIHTVRAAAIRREM